MLIVDIIIYILGYFFFQNSSINYIWRDEWERVCLYACVWCGWCVVLCMYMWMKCVCGWADMFVTFTCICSLVCLCTLLVCFISSEERYIISYKKSSLIFHSTWYIFAIFFFSLSPQKVAILRSSTRFRQVPVTLIRRVLLTFEGRSSGNVTFSGCNRP